MSLIIMNQVEDEISCPICFLNIETKDVCVTECNHKYHLSCLLKSLEIHNSCPLCRRQVKETPPPPEININNIILPDEDYDDLPALININQ